MPITDITAQAAITRFKENEDRVNVFTNDPDGAGFYKTNTDPPKDVETLPHYMNRVRDRFTTTVFKEDWRPQTAYAMNDIVEYGNMFWLITQPYTSSDNFDDDLQAGNVIPYGASKPYEPATPLQGGLVPAGGQADQVYGVSADGTAYGFMEVPAKPLPLATPTTPGAVRLLPSTLIFADETPGARTWTANDLNSGHDYIIRVVIKGAGGGGAGCYSQVYLGGGGGEGESVDFEMIVTPGVSYAYNIGGAGKGGKGGTVTGQGATNGGSTSFGGLYTAEGGYGGGLGVSGGSSVVRPGAGGGYKKPSDTPSPFTVYRIAGTPGGTAASNADQYGGHGGGQGGGCNERGSSPSDFDKDGTTQPGYRGGGGAGGQYQPAIAPNTFDGHRGGNGYLLIFATVSQ